MTTRGQSASLTSTARDAVTTGDERDAFYAALEKIAYSAHADTAPVLRGYAAAALAKVQA